MSFVNQIAVVSESLRVPFDEVARVTAALQKQVSRDLLSYWEIDATVNCFARLEDVPPGYWPVIVRDDIGFESAGIHCDKHGQPLALVTSGPDWPFTASHEVLEMLVDPYGRRMIAGESPMEGQGRVEFLVEISDPVADAACAYTVNGVCVSDFCTPHYFDPQIAAGAKYSYSGRVGAPRQVLQGGYLTWHDPVADEWWQQSWFVGVAPEIRKLGKLEDALCGLRSAVDAITARHRKAIVAAHADSGDERRKVTAKPRRTPVTIEEAAAGVSASSRAKASAWRARCSQIIAHANRAAREPN